MAYSTIEQLSLDINWYFADRFNRLCVAASAGGLLPNQIAESETNDTFHSLIMARPQEFKVARNESILNFIEGFENQNIDAYYNSFEELASRGVFAFDKLRLQDPEDGFYILAAYPVYDTETDPYPIDKKHLSLIPRVGRAIISRTNGSFSTSNFQPINLTTILNDYRM